MRAMKDSGIEWIGEIPQEWKIQPLKSLFSFGKGLPITKEDLKEKGISVVSYGQIHSKSNDGVHITPDLIRYVDEEYLNTNSLSLVNENDFIFADTSEDLDGCGNCVYDNLDIQLFAGYHTIILQSHTNQNNQYFAYLFKSDAWRKQIREQVTGVKLFSISQKILKSVSVIVPPFVEQQKISAYLDSKCTEIDSVISKTKATIEEYKKLKQSVITQAVTKGIIPNRPMKDSGIEWIGEIPQEWEVIKMKYLGKCRNGLTYSPDNLTDENNGTLVLRSSNIKDGKLVFTDNVYVNMNIRKELLVQSGDILICSRNGSRKLIGKNAIIPSNLKASFGAFMMIFQCKTPEYVKFILDSEIFSYYLGTFLTATINQLTTENFNNMQIVYCRNENEQQEIVNYLDEKCSEIDKLIAKKEQLLTEMENYKKALIYECVTGKKEVM